MFITLTLFYCRQVSGKCIRVFHYPKNFYDARARCKSESSDLAYIPSEDFQYAFTNFILDMTDKSQLYKDLQGMWFGGISSDAGEWKWLADSQPFNDFTMWKDNNPECSQLSCNSNDALVVNASNGFQWSAKDITDEMPYVCMQTCSNGYVWSQNLQKCIFISSDKK